MNTILYILGIVAWISWMGIFAWLAVEGYKKVGKIEKVEIVKKA